MSIFGSIMSAIFGTAKAQDAGAVTAPSTTPVPAGPTPLSDIDVAVVLTDLAAHNAEKLDWKKSIVDLMKLLHLDSSLEARKDLARELHYGGDTHDSAAMNVWLHKQVMEKLAANGGHVPAELQH